DAVRHQGHVPRWLQLAVLRDLRWYFAVDARERAPTIIVSAAMADVFHERVGTILRHVDVEALAAPELHDIDPEIRHALLAYKGVSAHSPVAVSAYDKDQGLLKVSYFFHGARPVEAFRGNDGRELKPAFRKDRACRFFRRTLFHERIAWLPADGMRTLEVALAGRAQQVHVGHAPALLAPAGECGLDIEPACNVLVHAQAGLARRRFGPRALRAAFIKWLARLPLVRRKYANAWVFIDREDDADDNAEHMYRWVRAHHPEVNAWFLLTRNSWHWDRLAREGFRLVTPGLRRKLLLLNSEHVVSSHAEHMDGGFARTYYGDMMNWRYSFLQHGVIKDDVSHWLSRKPFDLFITTSPAEHESIVGDGTPYTYTDREMRRTGLPRHDRLLALAHAAGPADVATILIMPTWRGSLVDSRASGTGDPLAAFAQSQYARRWRSVLRSPDLHELAGQHGKRIVFMPHPNAVPFIDAFAPPSHVEVLTAAGGAVQQAFAATQAFVTDYTSVAFSMAFLRRAVFYYQFDREEFYGGSHNWREGYFDYDRDGFGPVAFGEAELIGNLRRFLAQGARVHPLYLDRMIRAIPDQDMLACERSFHCILDTRRPRAGKRSTSQGR
ncbi:MAG: CDP-glycerol glycerophosphotransferase family protein, partial [Burkholderiales bacterium]|nr:CDP-glycerol glycerophosphotransferase family protein [Burkholderiales bacterium]